MMSTTTKSASENSNLPIGISKRIIEPCGDSLAPPSAIAATPKAYSTVSIVYSAYLVDTGAQFESSQEKAVRVRLGHRQCIRGLELAVQTMRRGETAEFVIAPEHAYGVDGGGERVPSNAAVRFVVCLKDWDDRIDVSVAGDGSIMKTVSTEKQWDESERCTMDGRVRIAYKAYAGSSDEPFETHTALEFIIGDDAVWMALERCALNLARGETALFECAVEPHLFEEFPESDTGFLQRARTTPPTSMVRFEVTMHNFENMPTPFQLKDSPAELLEIGAFYKARGTALYQRGRIARASKVFCAGVPFVRGDVESGGGGGVKSGAHLLQAMQELFVALHLNEAACALKLGDRADLERTCGEVLKREPANTKALLRMAAMYVAHEQLDEAQHCVDKVRESDRELTRDVLRQIAHARQEQEKRQRSLFGNIFGSRGVVGQQ